MKTEKGFCSSHVGLNVRDLDRSIEFYTSLFGFRLVSRIVLEDGLRIGFIELPEQFQIELVESLNGEATAAGAWNHVCFRVDDFEGAYRRLQEAKITFETDKLFVKEFWKQGMKFAFFRGPDGERLEIAEYQEGERQMDRDLYQRLLESLAAGEKRIEVCGVEIAVRSCFDREEGRLDPRTETAASLTREDFETRAGEIDPELLRNQDKLLGMDNPEGHSLLEQLRYQFGWRTLDRSQGIGTRSETIEMDGCRGTRWIYTPKEEKAGRPCLIFIHGGGFFGGDAMTVENQCRRFAELADAVVVSVDYPLSPEAKYPVAFHMCCDTVRWAWENAGSLGVDRGKIGISGDSAGGTMSVAVTLWDRLEGHHYLSYAGLIYPSVVWGPDEDTPFKVWKKEMFDNPYHNPIIEDQIGTTGRLKQKASSWYLKEGEDIHSPYINPVEGDLKGFPKTLIMTAEYDYLRPECELFTKLLKDAGVEVRHIRYGGIIHGTFDRLGYAPQVEDMLMEMAADLTSL